MCYLNMALSVILKPHMKSHVIDYDLYFTCMQMYSEYYLHYE